jgi:hypothetical protein
LKMMKMKKESALQARLKHLVLCLGSVNVLRFDNLYSSD